MRKCFAAFLITATSAFAADFATGQAARLVIGQPVFTQQDPGASDVLLGAVSGLAYANNMLFVADSNRAGAGPINNRVLAFKNLSAQLPAPTDEINPYSGRCPVCIGQASVVLGQPDFTNADLKPTAATSMRTPTAVATDGRHLVVADTDNNRLLIWNSIPVLNGQPPDVVVGQPNFTTGIANEGKSGTPSNRSFRGPQGVWIQNGKLFVADTQNNRVLIWNTIPTANFAPANVVLGQANFNAAVTTDLTQEILDPKPNNMVNPVSVTSDGIRLFVTDLGQNRVLIWNNIPTSNQAPADVEVGQPDMVSYLAGNAAALCPSNGTDSTTGDLTYPPSCERTLNFPRFALSDGTRLFIADGGADRVLVFNTIPTANGASADIVIGQGSFTNNQNSDSAAPGDRASSDTVRTPMSLAWDGTNLYVSDPYDRRILVFTPTDLHLPLTAVRNAFSKQIYAVGTVSLSGTIVANDTVTITINSVDYTYKIVDKDTLDIIVRGLVNAINLSNGGAGDPNVLASPNYSLEQVLLVARGPGEGGNSITLASTVSTNAQIVATASGANLAGGQDAARIAPGTLVTILAPQDGDLTDQTGTADTSADQLPLQLAGVQVYFDGIRAPLVSVSPTQVIAQVPFEVLDANSISGYVRAVRKNGAVTVTTAIGVPIVPQNPGILTLDVDAPDPRPAAAVHSSSYATGTVSVDGSVQAGDTATVSVEDRSYTYTVQSGDTLASIRDALITLINTDPKVTASAAGAFTRIRLKARVKGPEGNGIAFAANANSSASVIMTATNSTLCCANLAGAPITIDNPAIPGETIIVYATGLGLVQPDDARLAIVTGQKYHGPLINDATSFVSSLAGGKTANVLFAGLLQNAVGTYEVDLELNSDLPTNPLMQLTIAQDIYVSNIVTIPIVNPLAPVVTQ